MLTPTVRVHLIDTPGFDDTDRKDTDVLRDVAGWLGVSYKNNIRLSGMIYLHRIIDVRMQGTAKRNLFMFQKLCGSECFPHIVLATTMWSLVPPELGEQRERELIETDDFWGYMYDKGSQVLRHVNQNDRSSALAILDAVIRRRKKVTLQIQREMHNGKGLDETGAGQQLNSDILKERAKHRQEMKALEENMKDAIRERDQAAAAQIAELQAETAAKIRAGAESQKRLQIDLEKLQREREAEYKKLQDELKDQDAKFRAQNEEYLKLKSLNDIKQNQFDEELRRMKNELEVASMKLNEKERVVAQKKSGRFYSSSIWSF